MGDSNGPTLDGLLSIWPIVSSLATHASVGDLISLSRTSKDIRRAIHGQSGQSLNVGNHETPQWGLLKSFASYTCSAYDHRDPRNKPAGSVPLRPCRFCSRPICKNCIVRSFFANTAVSKNTFRSRARYLCPKCWAGGNLRKDFRYPISNSREHIWHGRGYAQRGATCSCSASEDNWLCSPCRSSQIQGFKANASLAESSSKSDDRPIECYGLGCTEIIDTEDRERRRICLWCSKPLARQFGGEDRLRWEEKQMSIRAAYAAARSADIGEWARNRFKSNTMSRREMRGGDAESLRGDPDAPTLLRHLDAVNYRAWVSETSAPTSQQIYESKHGRWTYNIGFLKSFGSRLMNCDCTRNFEFATDDLRRSTRGDAVCTPRTNRGMRISSALSCHGKSSRRAIWWLATQFVEAKLMTPEERESFWSSPKLRSHRFDVLLEKMYVQLEQWQDLSDHEKATWKPTETWASLTAADPSDPDRLQEHATIPGGLYESDTSSQSEQEMATRETRTGRESPPAFSTI